MSEQTFVLNTPTLGFGAYGPEDEQLHPQYKAEISSYALTETQFLGFSIPEHDIHAVLYLWCHPNLDVVTGGAAVWQGFKGSQTSCELYDWRSFMDLRTLGDANNFTLDNSYSVEVIEPFKTIRARYTDPLRDNAFDVTHTAIAPPAMLANRKHFEQMMKTSGTLTLRGKDYIINGYNIRDRSWGEARQEISHVTPPVSWFTGTFGDDLGFNCTCSEDPTRDVSWKSIYPDATLDGALKGGWLYRNGEMLRFTKASSLIERDPVYQQPRKIDLRITDERGQEHHLTGVAKAGANFHPWNNCNVPICMIEWQYDGRTGYGEVQDAQWTDFTHAMWKNARG